MSKQDASHHNGLSKKFPLTVTIITLNEESHIARAIMSAKWAAEILVVDSGSSDKTCEIARELGAKVLTSPWLGYGQQKNFAQDQAAFDWVLNIDADEAVSPQLQAEIIANIERSGSEVWGYRMPRKTFYLGQWIAHGGWYPNYLVRLSNRQHARWSEPSVHEALEVNGEVQTLTADLFHYAFDSIEEQVVTNLKYSRLGSKTLQSKGYQPSVLKLFIKPIGKFIETYVFKKGFLDGIAGFLISVNAAHSIFLKYSYLFEPKIRERSRETTAR